MGPTTVVITGPESSGKSELCQLLSDALDCTWVPEFARAYLEENGPSYNEHILETIYHGHLREQKRVRLQHKGLVIFDTDSINFKVWSQRVFRKTNPKIERGIQDENNHLYLICYPDLDWEPDKLRENPNDREEIFEDHLHLITELDRPFEIVKGEKEERLKNALAALQKLIPSNFAD